MDEESSEPSDNPQEESQEDNGKTELVSAGFFGDKPLEVGSECKVRIVHVYDDQVEIEYVPHEGDESGGRMKESMDKLDSMAQ